MSWFFSLSNMHIYLSWSVSVVFKYLIRFQLIIDCDWHASPLLLCIIHQRWTLRNIPFWLLTFHSWLLPLSSDLKMAFQTLYDISKFLLPLLLSPEDAMDLEWWKELQNAHRWELCIVICVCLFPVLEIIGCRQNVCKSLFWPYTHDNQNSEWVQGQIFWTNKNPTSSRTMLLYWYHCTQRKRKQVSLHSVLKTRVWGAFVNASLTFSYYHGINRSHIKPEVKVLIVLCPWPCSQRYVNRQIHPC